MCSGNGASLVRQERLRITRSITFLIIEPFSSLLSVAPPPCAHEVYHLEISARQSGKSLPWLAVRLIARTARVAPAGRNPGTVRGHRSRYFETLVTPTTCIDAGRGCVSTATVAFGKSDRDLRSVSVLLTFRVVLGWRHDERQ